MDTAAARSQFIRRGRWWATRTALLVALVAMSGCGLLDETQVNGRVAVSVSPAGSPVIVVAVCRGDVRRLDVSSARADLPAAHLVADSAREQSFDLDPADPGAGWSGPRLDRLQAQVTYVAAASGGSDLLGGKAVFATTDTEFTLEELAALDPSVVQTVAYTDEGEKRTVVVQTREAFVKQACVDLQ